MQVSLCPPFLPGQGRPPTPWGFLFWLRFPFLLFFHPSGAFLLSSPALFFPPLAPSTVSTALGDAVTKEACRGRCCAARWAALLRARFLPGQVGGSGLGAADRGRRRGRESPLQVGVRAPGVGKWGLILFMTQAWFQGRGRRPRQRRLPGTRSSSRPGSTPPPPSVGSGAPRAGSAHSPPREAG